MAWMPGLSAPLAFPPLSLPRFAFLLDNITRRRFRRILRILLQPRNLCLQRLDAFFEFLDPRFGLLVPFFGRSGSFFEVPAGRASSWVLVIRRHAHNLAQRHGNHQEQFLGPISWVFAVPRELVGMAPGRLATSPATPLVAVRPTCDGGRSKTRWPADGPSTATCHSSHRHPPEPPRRPRLSVDALHRESIVDRLPGIP